MKKTNVVLKIGQKAKMCLLTEDVVRKLFGDTLFEEGEELENDVLDAVENGLPCNNIACRAEIKLGEAVVVVVNNLGSGPQPSVFCCSECQVSDALSDSDAEPEKMKYFNIAFGGEATM